MRESIRVSMIGPVALFLGGCQTIQIPPSDTVLTHDQVRNLVLHPRRWFDRTITLQVYPYDFGSTAPQSYRICFEPCDEERANRTVAMLDTLPGRFSGYRGDRATVVTVRFQSNCARLPDARGRMVEICPDLIPYRFIETGPR